MSRVDPCTPCMTPAHPQPLAPCLPASTAKTSRHHSLSASNPYLKLRCPQLCFSSSNKPTPSSLEINDTCATMAVSWIFGLASLATTSLHAVSASSAQLQQPLFDDAHQATLIQAEKHLVESEALQDSISIDRLLKGAQDLYDIATLSSHEYNRPTRVIGSEGKTIPV